MVNASVDFVLNDEETLNAEFEVTPDVTYEAVIDLSSATRKHNELSNRDLPDQHPTSAITGLDDTLGSLSDSVSTIEGTIETYGDVVTHDTSEFATAEQGALADTALQPGDNISELVNDEGYLKAAALNGYATEGYVNAEIDNITDILDSYGDIVTHNVDEFATAEQGQLADTALQSGDNISELTNDANYATESFVEDKIEDVTDTFGDIVTHNVSEFATSAQGALADTALQPNDNISELNNDVGYITSASLPTVNNGGLTIQRNGSDLGTFTANQETNTTVNVVVPTQASDVNALPDTTTIADLTTTAQLNALNSGATTTNIGQITTNKNDISDINAKIPSQASSSNQLADKSFVNSSIATNTAYFIGTFNSVAELETYSGTLTNNDYAFVQTTDTAGNTLYDRYKWNGSEWLFEYELNNSSFTASQWATINSGATSSDVALAQSALQPNDNVSELVKDAGYITSSALPTVNNGTLTIQKNGVDVQTFSANQSTNATANITVPTKTSDIANDSGYITGITGSDVTTALGYTPYNSSNPSGYITATALNGYATQTWVNQQGYLTSISSSDITSALGYTPADDSGVVKTTGNQTIAGQKTFSSVIRRSSNVDQSATTGEVETGSLTVYDKDGTGFAYFNASRSSTTNTNRQRVTNKNIESTANWFDLRASVNDAGNGYASIVCGSGVTNYSLTYATASTTNTYIPTMGWVNNPSTSTNVVHRSGAETITGQKTFNSTSQPQVIRKNDNQSMSSATSEVVCTTSYRDGSNTVIATLGSYTFTSSSGIYMRLGSWAGYEGITVRANWATKESTTVINTDTTQVTPPTEDTTSSTQIDTVGARNTKINSVLQGLMPSGVILPFGGSTAPTGFLICDGSAVSRTDYANLFDVIGTTYGSGDGSTTFNLPNLSSGVLPSSSTVDVVGNGNALGIVDDISSETAQHNALVVGYGAGSFTTTRVPFSAFNLNTPLAIGSTSTASEFSTNNKALGVSTLPEWSGLTGSITGVSVNYIIKV